MCGINGAIAPKASRDWRSNLAWRLLYNTEIRGKHATGIGWHDENGTPQVVKAPLPASKFINSETYELFEEALPTTWIGHCRHTTKGTESNNYNNHPVFSKETGLILVHNGTVEDEKWRAKNEEGINPYILYDFDGQVDTEAILRLIETMLYIPRLEDGTIDPEMVAATPKDQWYRRVDVAKAIDDATHNISGGFACAVLVPEEPNTVYLFRHNNPIYVAYVPEYEAVVWASTEDILKKSLVRSTVEKVYGYFPKKKEYMPEYYGVDMPNKTLIRISATEDGFTITEREIAPPEYVKKSRSYQVTGKSGQAPTVTRVV